MFKLAIIFAAVVAINASGYGLPGYGPGYRADYSAPTPYSFGYEAVGGGGASSRSESGDGAGNVKGSYSLAVGDGRKRVVDYVADGAGFRAKVRTNEPGTDNQNPADVVVSAAPSPVVVKAAPVVVRTVKAAPSYAYGAGYGAGYGFGGYRGARGLGGYGGAYGLGGYGGAYGLGGYGGAYGLGGYGGAYGYGGYGSGYSRTYSRGLNRGGYYW